MDTTQALAGMERATKLVDNTPYQVVAAVFGIAFCLTLALLLWREKSRGDLAIELAVGVKTLGTIMDRVELLPPKRGKRITNPGRKPAGGAE